MMQIEAVVTLFPDLDRTELQVWIERGWVRPDGEGGGGTGGAWVFTEIDVARVRLVRDLRRELAVPEDTVPLVLSLMDQMFTLRGALKAVRRAVETQPPMIRAALLKSLRDLP